MIQKFLFLGLFVFAISCAHHRDVRPSADGEHRVAVQAEDTQAGSRDAIAQANHYCKEQGKSAVFINEEQKYTGSMNESTYKNAKTAAKVAKAAGGAAWVFGRKKGMQDTGSVVGIGGGIADSAIGEGYSVNMKFKCQ